MNSFNLKMVAIIAMLIDHIGGILFVGTQYEFYFRVIGRIAFPIFCFLIVEGFYHTSNLRRYMLRLGVFAIISEVPFDLAFSDYTTPQGILEKQNVFFTLYIGLVTIMLMRRVSKKFAWNQVISSILNVMIVFSMSIIIIAINSDYTVLGILLIVAFYLFRGKKTALTIAVLALTFSVSIQIFAVFSMLFIWYYNGEKGRPMNKYIFYAFYPLHLLALVGIRYLMGM